MGIKKLTRLSRLTPQIVLQKIATAKIEPPISDSVDEFTSEVRESLMKDIKTGKLLMKNPPPKRNPEKPLTKNETLE